MVCVFICMCCCLFLLFFFSSRRRHTRCALVTGVQTCALPICRNWVFKNDAQKAWLEACVAKGYTVPDWPKAYGGAGLTPEQTKVFKQEMKRIHARSPLDSFGIWMLGPALLQFGPAEPKVAYLNRSEESRVGKECVSTCRYRWSPDH